MRYIYTIALSFLIISCGNEADSETPEVVIEEVDSTYCLCADLQFDERYNHFFLFTKREGFTGECEEFYPNGQVSLEKNFVDGKMEGPMISYHDNGNVWVKEDFKDNFQIGDKFIYTRSGKLKHHSIFKRGRQTEIIVDKPELRLEE